MEPWNFAVFQGVYLHLVLLDLSARYCPWNRCERIGMICSGTVEHASLTRIVHREYAGQQAYCFNVLLANLAPKEVNIYRTMVPFYNNLRL